MSALDEQEGATRIEVRPGEADGIVVVEVDDRVRIAADDASLGAEDNLTFYRENVSVAHVRAEGVPCEVPNIVRRARIFGETAVWEANR